MLVCVVTWEENGSRFIDHKIIGKDIPEEVAVQLVENGDAEIIEVDEQQ